VTELIKLKRFMNPHYQLPADVEILEDYLTEYTYAECAAGKLWEEKATSYTAKDTAVTEVTTGGEKFKLSSPETAQKTAITAANLYNGRCKDKWGNLGCAIRITQSTVAGIPGKPVE